MKNMKIDANGTEIRVMGDIVNEDAYISLTDIAKYKNPDNDPQGPWQNTTAFAPGGTTHQGMVYAIQHPFTGKMMYPTRDAHWRYQQEQMLEIMRGWCNYELKELDDAHERAAVCGLPPDEVRQGVKAIVLSEPLDISFQKAKKVYERGQWPRFYFTSGGKGGIRRKTYMESVGGKPSTNYWPFSKVGHFSDKPLKIGIQYVILVPVDKPSKPRSYRLFRRFPA